MPWRDSKGLSLPLTEKQRRLIIETFDFDKDGKLGVEDLRRGLQKMGVSFSWWRARQALRHADTNRNGFVDEDELDKLFEYASRWNIKPPK